MEAGTLTEKVRIDYTRQSNPRTGNVINLEMFCERIPEFILTQNSRMDRITQTKIGFYIHYATFKKVPQNALDQPSLVVTFPAAGKRRATTREAPPD